MQARQKGRSSNIALPGLAYARDALLRHSAASASGAWGLIANKHFHPEHEVYDIPWRHSKKRQQLYDSS